MRISARVDSGPGHHQVTVSTNGNARAVSIPPKANGPGSSVNGGELLFLALATCYCNDVYREAGKRGLEVQHVEVEVSGDFGAEGEPARNLTYRAWISGPGDEDELRALAIDTDRVAEIHNTLRGSTAVTLERVEVVPPPTRG